MIDVYILYGAPGVGKGTVSKKLPSAHCLGTGNILRSRNLGLDGNLVPDDLVNSLVKEEILKRKQYVILDGYPRTKAQAEYLLSLKNIRLCHVYELNCPDKELENRLSLRQSCVCGATYHPDLKPSKISGKCDLCGSKLFRRKDDASEIVKKRLQEYHKLTEPILKKFGKIVQHIDVSTDFMSGIMSIVNEIKREQKIRRVRIRSLAQCRQNEG